MKKFLTFILVLAMVMSVSSFAMAAEYTVTDATDLEAKLEGSEDAEITLETSITGTASDYYSVTKNITLNLGGNEFNTNQYIYVKPGGSLTVKNGTIKYTGSKYAIAVMGDSSNQAYLKVEDDVSIISTNAGITVWGNCTVDTAGDISAPNSFAIGGNGTAEFGNTVINVTGGNVEGKVGIYHPQAGKLNISGGTITGVESGIAIKAGTLNITGGKVECTGPDSTPTSGNSNGTSASGAAIQIESNDDYAGNVKVNISDGEITSTNGVAVYEFKEGTTTDTQVSGVAITGGEITSANGKPVVMISSELNSNPTAKPSISGGKFSAAPAANLIADGKAAANVGNGTDDAPFTIEPAKTSGSITIAPASLDFGTVKAGYAQPEAKMISVQGVDYDSNAYVTFTVTDGFEVSSAKDNGFESSEKINVVDGTTTYNVYVRPVANLGAKTYTGSVTVQVNNTSDHPTLNDDNEVALTFVVEPNSSQTVENPSSGGGYYGPNVWYIGGNTFGTNTNQVPTSVEIDGVPVSFTMNGSQITVGCIQPGSGWVTVRWGSVSNYRSFTPDANAYCTQTVIPKTGGMSIWAAIAQFLGF